MITAKKIIRSSKRTILLFNILSATSSCSNNELPKDSFGCVFPAGYERVLITPAVPYQPWQVRATAKGLTWNSAVVSDTEIKNFAERLAKLPISTGSTVFEVTKSVSCDDRTRVRLALARSGLCKQGRCWEQEETVKAPIVY